MEEQSAVVPGVIEAEKMLLGSLIASPDATDIVLDRVVREDFLASRHRVIYAGISELASKGVFSTPEVLSVWLGMQGTLGDAGGRAYLEHLAENPASTDGTMVCSEAVLECSVLRQLAEAATEILDEVKRSSRGDACRILAAAEQRVVSIADRGARGRVDLTPVSWALKAAFEVLVARSNSDGGVTGLPTGYAELDEMTTGLQPAMGKTTLALNIVEHVAIKAEKPVAVFSMEMSADQLAMRLISSVGRINATRLRTGRLEGEEWSRVTTSIKTLRDARIFIDDTPALSPEMLRSKARQLKRKHGLGLIVIDYLQLMQVPGTGENRAAELSDISRSIKALAKELNVPVIALSQLNRSLETRADKRPVMADLRGSGALEDDADVIVFIYRDDYYNREHSRDKGVAEVIMAKQRNGPTGTIRLEFMGEYCRFRSLSEDSVGFFE